jgi:uncharacterized protein YutD
MKQKFKIILTYFKPVKEPIDITWFIYDGDPNWFTPEISNDISIQQNILNLIIEIAENSWDDMLENVYSELNNYQYILTIDSINNEIRLKCLVEENTDSDDYSTYDIDNVVTLDYLKDNNINEITCEYSGYGDDGTIENITVNGESSNDDEVKDIIHLELEKTFMGWEMDSGGYGNIMIDNKGTITFNHTWRETEWFDSEWEKTLTINNIDDER